jgi:DNA-binding transcriptional MerR regulator
LRRSAVRKTGLRFQRLEGSGSGVVKDDGLLTIGRLARRTGLPARTIRFYSDAGLVPESGRSTGGYRLYDGTALARLELVRTLRDLGLGLDAIRSVLAGAGEVDQLARRHIAVLDEQISALARRRAVLRAVVKRQSTIEELILMNKLATMSDEERERVVAEFWDATFGGLDIHPELEGKMRSVRPRLGDDPSAEQLEAWVELAELVQDPGFRERVRGMAAGHSERRQAGEELGPAEPEQIANMEEVSRLAREAAADGIDPRSPEAASVVDRIAELSLGERYADRQARRELAETWRSATDPRVDRLWALLGVINGWPQGPDAAPGNAWVIEAFSAE